MHASPSFFVTTDDGIRLAGSLELPPERCFATVVLLTGSGPLDRDESIAGVRPFAMLRHELARRGFAAASWDDRGVGESTGDYLATDDSGLVSDVGAVIRFVRRRLPEIPVVLAGHSQGALIAAQVADTIALDGLVLMAGAFRPGRQVLESQHRRICESEEWAIEDIESSLAFKEECFDILESYDVRLDETAALAMRTDLRRVADRWGMDEGEANEIVEDLAEWEWRYLLRYRGEHNLSRITCPTLVLVGDRDTQVDPVTDADFARRHLEEGACNDVEALVLRDLNHLFQETSDGSLSAYSELGEPFHARAISALAGWLTRRFA